MSVEDMISERFSPDDHPKARKSLISAAILAIVLAGIDITSEQFSLYVFTVKVEQETLVASAQIVTSVLLAIFLIRIFPTFLEQYRAYSIKKLGIQANIDRTNVYEGLFGPGHTMDDYDGSPESEIKWVADKWKAKQQRKEASIDRISLIFSTFTETILNFLVPTLLAIIAISHPELPKTLALEIFAEQSEIVGPVEESETEAPPRQSE